MNDTKLLDAFSAVFGDSNPLVRVQQQRAWVEAGKAVGGTRPVSPWNAAGRFEGRSVAEEGRPKVARAIDRGLNK